MAYRPSRYNVTVRSRSSDGNYWGPWPDGNRPGGAALAGAATDTTSATASLTTSPVGSSSFNPSSGYTISTPSGAGNYSTITVTGPGGFGLKPFSAKPLLWAPGDTTVGAYAPHPTLSRITTFQGAPVGGGLTYSPTGGPNGNGCFTGSGNPSSGIDGSGVLTWAQGIDYAQWSGWGAADPYGGGNGVYMNDYGHVAYLYRKVWRNFGHLDQNATLSYNGKGSYNFKLFRQWRVNPIGGVGVPIDGTNPADVYFPENDQIFTVEYTPVSVTPPSFQDYPSGGGSQDWSGETVAAVVSFSNIQNTWYPEEMILRSNSSASVADANFNWRVPSAPVQGPFAGGSAYNFPLMTYHQIGQQFNNGSANSAQTLAGNVRGTWSRAYPMHWIIDSSAGSGHASAAPAGSYVQCADVYYDDSAFRIVATNSNVWLAETTGFEIQIPITWTDTQVSFAAHNIAIGMYLWVYNDATKTAYLVGQRTS